MEEMNVHHLCVNVLCNEGEKYNVFVDPKVILESSNNDSNFHEDLKRVNFLYKYGAFNILFFKHCIELYCSKKSTTVIDDICKQKKLKICSLSTGPTDVVAFLYSVQQMGKKLPEDLDIKVLNKFPAWKNISLELLTYFSQCFSSTPAPENIKFVYCDISKNLKQSEHLKNFDLLLMFLPFAPSESTPIKVNETFKVILQSMKTGSTLLLVMPAGDIPELQNLGVKGKFLYGPENIHLKDISFDNSPVSNLKNVKPKSEGEFNFCIWMKTSKEKKSPDLTDSLPSEDIQESIKNTSSSSFINVNDDSNYLNPLSSGSSSMSNLNPSPKTGVHTLNDEIISAKFKPVPPNQNKTELNSLLELMSKLTTQIENCTTSISEKAQDDQPKEQREYANSCDSPGGSSSKTCLVSMAPYTAVNSRKCCRCFITCGHMHNSCVAHVCDSMPICCNGRAPDNFQHDQKPSLVIPISSLNDRNLSDILAVLQRCNTGSSTHK